MQHVACFIYITRRTGHAPCSMFYLYYLGELGMQHVVCFIYYLGELGMQHEACFIYITRRAGQWACSMQHVLSILPRRTGHAACNMYISLYPASSILCQKTALPRTGLKFRNYQRECKRNFSDRSCTEMSMPDPQPLNPWNLYLINYVGDNVVFLGSKVFEFEIIENP